MRTKSADQIQAEIELIRLAYRERCDAEDRKGVHPLLHAAPYLASFGIMAAAVIWLLF